jgi:hypothetical protein
MIAASKDRKRATAANVADLAVGLDSFLKQICL